jgi:hypothetical protein
MAAENDQGHVFVRGPYESSPMRDFFVCSFCFIIHKHEVLYITEKSMVCVYPHVFIFCLGGVRVNNFC